MFIPALPKVCLVLLVVEALGTSLSAQSDNSLSSEPQNSSIKSVVDFDRDVFPILKSRCFECHSERANEGDLRLDNEQQAHRGGHTGRLLLVSPAEKSELYQRLISSDPSYRMPKNADPLSTSELALIKAWLDQGSKWSSQSPVSLAEISKGVSRPNSQKQNDNLFEFLGERINEFQENSSRPKFRYLSNLLWVVVAWTLLLILTVLNKSKGLWRRWPSRGSAVSDRKQEQTTKKGLLESICDRLLLWRWLLLSTGCILGMTVILYQMGTIEELEDSVQKVESKLRRQPPLRVTEDRKNLVLPVYPDHPPRLGGKYYRGNDERDPSLFNGGVYRTATMDLGLFDQDNQPVKWDAKVAGEPLTINLVIHRAPRTTPALFSEEIFHDTYLRRFRETDLVSKNMDDESKRIGFTVAEPSQSWIARVPLEPSSDWKEGRNAGVIYVAYGSRETDGYVGRVHYGIRYDLRIKNGLLERDSVLWMGVIYDLGGRVLIPQRNEILLHHWFDYRPLPVIETDNPDDPELLGLPEHLRDR